MSHNTNRERQAGRAGFASVKKFERACIARQHCPLCDAPPGEPCRDMRTDNRHTDVPHRARKSAFAATFQEKT